MTELWRYPDATACMNARTAAREAPEWRAAIAKVAPMVQVRARQQLGRARAHASRRAELQHAVPQPGGLVTLAVGSLCSVCLETLSLRKSVRSIARNPRPATRDSPPPLGCLLTLMTTPPPSLKRARTPCASAACAHGHARRALLRAAGRRAAVRAALRARCCAVSRRSASRARRARRDPMQRTDAAAAMRRASGAQAFPPGGLAVARDGRAL